MPAGKTKSITDSKKRLAQRAKAAAKPAKKPKTTATKRAKPAPKAAKPTPARAKAGGTATASPPRRAIFIDVENTSNEAALTRVIESLKIDRAAQPTEFYAVGNWRAVGQTMSRHLARLGASLVHSAPVTGVRDWSDLWIAVAAGRWIALAKPGDVLEIVSDDKAFEAVGDAAATQGVIFRRLLHRSGSARATASAASAAETPSDAQPRRRRRRGGRGRRRGNGAANTSTHSSTREHAATAKSEPRKHEPRRQESARRPERRHEPQPRPVIGAGESTTEEAAAATDAHGASQEHILATIRRLTNGDPNKWVNLDVIATALKAEGFVRPPGSTRLVVRLRRMKDIEVQPSGMVRLLGA